MRSVVEFTNRFSDGNCEVGMMLMGLLKEDFAAFYCLTSQILLVKSLAR